MNKVDLGQILSELRMTQSCGIKSDDFKHEILIALFQEFFFTSSAILLASAACISSSSCILAATSSLRSASAVAYKDNNCTNN